MTSCDLFIFCGECSGDLHGAAVVKELKVKNPLLSIGGVCGPAMRKEEVKELLPMEQFQVMGFIDVFLSLPRLVKNFFLLRKVLLSLKPKAILFIDYPGFSLRLEKSLKKKGFSGKLIHYICPSVWAWGKKRIPSMAHTLDLLLCILPFEPPYFSRTPLKVIYVGNPLLSSSLPLSRTSLPDTKQQLLTLFPGSRRKEILRNLPLQLHTAHFLLSAHPSLRLQISIAHPSLLSLIQETVHSNPLENSPIDYLTPQDRYAAMEKTSLAIATSGTVTLELALRQIPTIVTYPISLLDLWIATKIFKISLPFYSLPNLIAQKEIFPELFGPFCTKKNLEIHASRLLSQEEDRKRCIEGCQRIRQILTEQNASLTAAKEILHLIKKT